MVPLLPKLRCCVRWCLMLADVFPLVWFITSPVQFTSLPRQEAQAIFFATFWRAKDDSFCHENPATGVF